MTDTASPAPVPAPIPPAPTITPGYKTSEAWITALAMFLGVLPSTGLLTNAPLAAKLVGMAIAALTALGYTTNRTSLKKAHLALIGGLPQSLPVNANKPATALTGVAAAGVALMVAFGCAGTQQAATAVAAGGDAFLQCEGVNLSQLVGSTGVTLLKTVADDLVGGNYVQAIADLIGTLGAQQVGCAVLAVDTIAEAGKTSGAAAISPIEARAREMIVKYNWKTAPITTPVPPASTGSGAPHAELDACDPLTINGTAACFERVTSVAIEHGLVQYASTVISL